MTYSVLQSVSAAANSGLESTKTVTLTSNVASGTKLIAAVSLSTGVGGSATTIKTVEDAAGNAFSRLAVETFPNTPSGEVSLWALDTPGGDVGTKPVITASTPGAALGQISLLVQEVSGLATGSSLAAMIDGTPGVSNGHGGSSTGSPSYVSSAAGEYLVAVYGDDGGPETWVKPLGTTADPHAINTNSFADVVIAYSDSTNGTEAGSFALSGTAADWGAILCAFQLVSANDPVVTVTQAGGTAGGMAMSVIVLTNAVEGGGANAQGQQIPGAAQATVTPNFSSSAVYWAITNGSTNGTAWTLNSNNSFAGTGCGDFNDSHDLYRGTTGNYTGTVTSGVGVTVGASAPTANDTAIAAYEIRGAAGSPVVDASTPAFSTTGSTGATSISSSAFTPPAGAVLVVVVASNASGSALETLSISDTLGGLTWTRRAISNTAGNTDAMAAVYTATVPVAGVTVSPPLPPGMFPPLSRVFGPTAPFEVPETWPGVVAQPPVAGYVPSPATPRPRRPPAAATGPASRTPAAGGISQPPIPPQSLRDVRRPPRIPRSARTPWQGSGVSQPPIPPSAVRDTRRPVKIPPRGSAPAWQQGVSQPPVPPVAQHAWRRPARFPRPKAWNPPEPPPPFAPPAEWAPPQRPARWMLWRYRRAAAAGPGTTGVSQPPAVPQALRGLRKPWPRKGSAPAVPPAPAVIVPAVQVPQAAMARRRPARLPPPRSAPGWEAGVSQPPVPPQALRDARRPPRFPRPWAWSPASAGVSQPLPVPGQPAQQGRRKPWPRRGQASQPFTVAPVTPAVEAPQPTMARRRPVRLPRAWSASPPSSGFTPGQAARSPQPAMARRISAALLPRRGQARGWEAGISQPPVPPQAVRDVRRPARFPRPAAWHPPVPPPPYPPPAAGARRMPPRQRKPVTGQVASPQAFPVPPPVPVVAGARRFGVRLRKGTTWQPATPQAAAAPAPAVPAVTGARRFAVRMRKAAAWQPPAPQVVPPPPAIPVTAGARRFPVRLRKGLAPPTVPSPGFTPPAARQMMPAWRPRWFRSLLGRRGRVIYPLPPGAPLVPVPPGATVTDPREGLAFAAADPREGVAGIRDLHGGTVSAAADPREGAAAVSDPREGRASPAS